MACRVKFPHPGHRLLGPVRRLPWPALPAPARSACEVHREWIEAQVRLGRNATAIYQELVDRFGFRQRYNSVKRFCRALRSQEPEQFDRLEFLPGEECQVDYGEGALTRHPHSGRYRRPRLFIMTLRYSRRSYRQWCGSRAARYGHGCTSKRFDTLGARSVTASSTI